MADFLYDSFTEASTVALTSHTPETGGGWAAVTGSPTTLNVISLGFCGSQNSGSAGVARCTATPPSADYSVIAISRINNLADFVGPIARCSSSAQTYYMAYISNNNLYLAKYVAGSFTSLTSTAFTTTLNTDYTVTLTVAGDQISASADATSLGPVTDTSITAAGYAGMQAKGTDAYVNIINAAPLASSYSVTTPSAGTIRQLSGGATGTASISATGTYAGTAPDQARLVQDGTSTAVSGFDWATIGSATGGNWSHTFTSVPKGGWYNVQVRNSGSGDSVTSGKVGAGVLVMVDGQSSAWLWFSSTAYAGDSSLTPDAKLRVTGKQASNAWNVPATTTMNAAIACGNALVTALSCPVGLIDGSWDGSGLTLSVNSGQWVSGGGAGNAYTSSDSALTSAGGACAATIWIQGESDADNDVTQSDYYTALGALFGLRRTALSNSSHPYILALLARNTAGLTDAQVEAIKKAQVQKCADTAVYRVERADLPLHSDGTHHTATGYATLGARCAQAVLHALGEASSSRGPSIDSVQQVSSTAFDVNITLRGSATDYTPTSSITGFRALVSGSPVTISSIAQQSATKIRVTLSSAPGSLPTFDYMWGAAPTITGAVKDNSSLALPLEYNSGVLATAAGVALLGGLVRSKLTQGRLVA